MSCAVEVGYIYTHIYINTSEHKHMQYISRCMQNLKLAMQESKVRLWALKLLDDLLPALGETTAENLATKLRKYTSLEHQDISSLADAMNVTFVMHGASGLELQKLGSGANVVHMSNVGVKDGAGKLASHFRYVWLRNRSWIELERQRQEKLFAATWSIIRAGFVCASLV